MSTASTELRLSHLSLARQMLVRRAQSLVFGTICQLHVRGGDPVFDPAPTVIVKRKNGSATSSHPARHSVDFALKKEWIDLFADFTTIGDGIILKIEVAHGLPILHEFEDVIRQ